MRYRRNLLGYRISDWECGTSDPTWVNKTAGDKALYPKLYGKLPQAKKSSSFCSSSQALKNSSSFITFAEKLPPEQAYISGFL
jgi:hypothetical protein